MVLFQNKKYIERNLLKEKRSLSNLSNSSKKFHKISENEFQKFFRLYMHAIKTKELFFIYTDLTSNILDLVKCLESHSRIAGYSILSAASGSLGRDKVKIFLHYDLTKNKPLVQKIILFSSRGRKRIATQRMLNVFHYHYPHSLGIIGTRYGIMSSKECQAKNYGGEFIVSIT